MSIAMYTDGGCHGNPGPGAWAYAVVDVERDTVLTERSGYHTYTTNNRMELQAVIEALRHAQATYADAPCSLFTDSQYVQKGITVWIHTWMNNNWRTKAKQPVKNVELWQALYRAEQDVAVAWHWVKGHDHSRYNEYCHNLVQEEILQRLKQTSSHS